MTKATDTITKKRKLEAIRLLDKACEMEGGAFLVVVSGMTPNESGGITFHEQAHTNDPRLVGRLLNRAYDDYRAFVDPEEEPTEEEEGEE